jgi:hypothetical protein
MHCGFLLLTSFFNQAVLTNIEGATRTERLRWPPISTIVNISEKEKTTVYSPFAWAVIAIFERSIYDFDAQILFLLSQQSYLLAKRKLLLVAT